MIILNRKLLVILVIVLAVVGVIAANYIFKSEEVLPQQTQNPDGSSTMVKESPTNEPSPFLGKPKNQIPKYTGRSLDEIRYGRGFSDPGNSAIEKKRDDLKILAAVLTASPMGDGGVDDWIAVGVIKKFFNDFEGARDAWEYAGVLYPGNALSFANLGNLYGFYLHDNIKAELNFTRAIENDSYQTSYYIGFADFYKNVYVSKKSEAVNVILEGMSIIKDVNFPLYLASYYRDEDDKANAIKYYQEVLKLSPNHPGITEEIDRLR